MFGSPIAFIITLFIAQVGYSQSNPIPKLIAEGDWSKPVTDKHGFSVRGRLIFCVKHMKQARREFAVYVELQDVTNSVNSGGMELFCDMGKIDFRPEYKGGLQAELRDKRGNVFKPTGYPYGGAIPLSEWIRLPSDGLIRVRATPFGIDRGRSMVISPEMNKLWVIGEDDRDEYFLSGSFTIDPVPEQKPMSAGHIWRGKIDLPTVRLSNQRK